MIPNFTAVKYYASYTTKKGKSNKSESPLKTE